MSAASLPLTEQELAVLELATEDAYALFEVADAVGGDLAVAADVVTNLLRLGLVELGVEDWSTEPPAHIVDGKYVGIAFEGDVQATLADRASWRADERDCSSFS